MMMRRAPKGKPRAKRTGRAGAGTRAAKPDAKKMPELSDFIDKRDYTGAVTLMEFKIRSDEADADGRWWLAYAAFHLGDYRKALDAYEGIVAAEGSDVDDRIHLYMAACYYYMGMYTEALKEADKGPASPLQTRLHFHLAHRMNDETKLMLYHQKLTDSKEDQLSLAAIHYSRSHFQEATDIYKRLLLENRDDLAINVYVAMCYYKLDYYDVSLEILQVYLQSHPHSPVVINLKACNHFRLYNGEFLRAPQQGALGRPSLTTSVAVMQARRLRPRSRRLRRKASTWTTLTSSVTTSWYFATVTTRSRFCRRLLTTLWRLV